MRVLIKISSLKFKMSSDTHESDEGGGKRANDEENAEASFKLLDELRREEVEADEFNFLSDDDIQVFGIHPVTDILKLVRCNICRKPLIERQFPRHYEQCASLKLDRSRYDTEGRPDRSKRRDRRDAKGTRTLRNERSPGPQRNDGKSDSGTPTNLAWNHLVRRRRSIRPASKGSINQTPRGFGSDCVELEAPRFETGPTSLRESKPDESAVRSRTGRVSESQAPGKRGQDTAASMDTDDGRFKFPVDLKTGGQPRELESKNRVDDVKWEKTSHQKKQGVMITSYSSKQGVDLQVASRAKRFGRVERHEEICKGDGRKQDHDVSEGSQDARTLRRQKRERLKNLGPFDGREDGSVKRVISVLKSMHFQYEVLQLSYGRGSSS